MSQLLIDITPPISPALAVWPGDTPFSRRFLCQISRGDNIDLSTITATLHLGAHADGPSHYADSRQGALGVGQMPLDHYLGPCQVIHTAPCRGRRVAISDLQTPLADIRTPRILLRTNSFDGFAAWNADFAGVEPTLIDALAQHNVKTIGIDTPSVDPQDSKNLPAHQAIYRASIAILEGLDLADVAPGEYELIALPLRLMDCDASPVRAVLRK